MPREEEHIEMKRLLEENNRLVASNNKLLKKMYRHSVLGLVFRVIWYAILIGIPFALYLYVLEPYFEAFGSSYDTFIQGIEQLPGLKGLGDILGGGDIPQ